MSEKSKGATSGGMQGAAAGASFGAAVGSVIPVVGTAIGAVVGGIVGGVAGALGGAKGGGYGDTAIRKQRMANFIQFQREQEAYRQQYLRVLREGRIQRASSLAAAVAMGIEGGSGAQASVSSIGSQIANQVEYMSVDRAREIIVSYLQGESARYQKKSSDTMGMVSTASTVVGAIGTAISLGSSLAASSAATTAAKAGVNGISQASGVGSSAATQAASNIAGTTGAGIVSSGSGVAFSNTAGYFSSEVWNKAATQLYQRAMLQQSLTNATMQVGRSYYSGTRLQRA